MSLEAMRGGVPLPLMLREASRLWYKADPGLSPSLFGPIDTQPQKTLITDGPLEVGKEDMRRMEQMAVEVSDYISRFPLRERVVGIGADEMLCEDYMKFDEKTRSQMVWGGLDVYKDPKRGFVILEINPLAQFLGLQDYREQAVGAINQPTGIEHITSWLRDMGFKGALVLGSTKNAFWRGHNRVAEAIKLAGMDGRYADSQSVQGLVNDGFRPDVVIRFCSPVHIMRHGSAAYLREYVMNRGVPVVNSLSSTLYGYRGFLREIGRDLPYLFPEQVELDKDVSEVDLVRHPWIKLEAAGFEYVVNYAELRRWGKEALLSLIRGNTEEADRAIGDRQGGDAGRLIGAQKAVAEAEKGQVKWLAQAQVEPVEVKLSVDGQEADLKILHRVYWVKDKSGGVRISIEGFGCTPDQFSRSKGKINAGTGIAVPMVVS